ncbi:MAG: lysophospholipid acyltransferase family protein [Polyangiales bacterium]
MGRVRTTVLDAVRPWWRAASLVGITGGMGTIAEAHMAMRAAEERAEVWDFYYRRWARALLMAFGVHVLGAARSPTSPDRARLVVANHRSPLDIAILVAAFGGQVLSRADLATWPVLGRAARIAGTIFVDREDGASGARAIRAIRERLRAKKTVIVFPEGTTFAGDEVRPFRAGAFVAAKGLDVEIVPVGLAYPPGAEWTEPSFMAHVRRVAERPDLRVGFASSEGFTSTSPRDDAARAQAEVQARVHEARAQLERGEK